MRRTALISIALVALATAACDQLESVAGVGDGTGSTGALTMIPTQVQLVVGTTAQLSTNAPSNLVTQLQWSSSAPGVAGVNPSGLVTGLSLGTATITARYSFDTTKVATASVVVSGPSGTTSGTITGQP